MSKKPEPKPDPKPSAQPEKPKAPPPAPKVEVKAEAAPKVEAEPKPPSADRIIRLSLVPTQGAGIVVKLVKDWPRDDWSEGIQENWGLLIDEGEHERPIAAICLNIVLKRQEVNLQPVNVADMAAAVVKYTALGWTVEHAQADGEG